MCEDVTAFVAISAGPTELLPRSLEVIEPSRMCDEVTALIAISADPTELLPRSIAKIEPSRISVPVIELLAICVEVTEFGAIPKGLPDDPSPTNVLS